MTFRETDFSKIFQKVSQFLDFFRIVAIFAVQIPNFSEKPPIYPRVFHHFEQNLEKSAHPRGGGGGRMDTLKKFFEKSYPPPLDEGPCPPMIHTRNVFV